MRIWNVVSTNGKELLRQTEQAKPVPGAGEVLVQIRAASLNHRDLYIHDQFGSQPEGTSIVPLSDGAGEVAALGAGVRHFQVGDRVVLPFFPLWLDGPMPEGKLGARGEVGTPGVLADYVVAKEQELLPLPAYLSYAEGATLPCAGVTVWNALFAAGSLRANETVLLQGTGGVSIFGLQIAKAAGARTIVLSRSQEKLASVRSLGADETINTTTHPQWDQQALALTEGLGVDHILEVGGVETLSRSLKAVRLAGNICLIGGLGGFSGLVEFSEIRQRFSTIQTVYVGSLAMFKEMNDFLTQHQIHPVIDRIFPPHQAKEAFTYLGDATHIGKVVIEWEK